jgi:hypothetical protein
MAELTPLITAWIRFAEEDWDDALILSRSGGKPRSICFHAQQCIEKLFKAELMRLQAIVPREIPSRKCRDLLILSNRLAGTIPGWQPDPETLNSLTQAALAYLDPGEDHPEPTEDTACAAGRGCSAARLPAPLVCQPGGE